MIRSQVMIHTKIHRRGDEILLAACDEEVLGRNLTEGEFCLSVDRRFYEDKFVNIDELAKLLDNATMANLTGNKVVNRAIELGFISEDCIAEISEIKHAQIVLF